MNAAARSLFAFGLYLVGAGTGLLLVPGLLLAPLQIPVPADVWIRVCGMLALLLGSCYLVAARSGAQTLVAWSVWVRASVVVFFGAFVASGLAPAALLVFAAVDLAGAVWTALALRGTRVRLVAPLALLLLGTQVDAAPTAFFASFDAESDIVEVVDPTVPLVRVQTSGTGTGVLDLVAYHSGDLVNLATGQGAGSNRYVDNQGDELFGSFDVQLIPGNDPGAFALAGLVGFTGGTGRYAGASGQAVLSGSGQFTSETHALMHFDFSGELRLLPEPPLLPLLAAGLMAAGLRRRHGGSGRAGRCDTIAALPDARHDLARFALIAQR